MDGSMMLFLRRPDLIRDRYYSSLRYSSGFITGSGILGGLNQYTLYQYYSLFFWVPPYFYSTWLLSHNFHSSGTFTSESSVIFSTVASSNTAEANFHKNTAVPGTFTANSLYNLPP